MHVIFPDFSIFEAEGHGPVQKSGPIRVIWTGTPIWTDSSDQPFINQKSLKGEFL